MAGIGARTALELGLNVPEPLRAGASHQQVPEFPRNDSGDLQRRILFCCLYDLDSWSSFLTGLPRVLPAQLSPDQVNCLV